MFIILTLIIIVAAFNIISVLTILIKNKSKEIAILRSIGFQKFNIKNIYFYRYINWIFWNFVWCNFRNSYFL